MCNQDVMFSIIIPVYNVAPYLKECLDSIINQTFKDFEVVCVNDGSTDNSLEILNEYAQKDDRIKVYSQENQGSGVARNYGLDMAKGKYIAFVDPDDWIELNYLETLYNTFQKTGVEVIQFDYKKVNDISKEVKFSNYTKFSRKLGCKKNLHKEHYFNKNDFNPVYLLRNTLMVWNRIYSASFVRKNQIKFAPTIYGQDNLFSIGVLLCAPSIFYLEEHLYNYRNRPNSAVNRKTEKHFCHFDNIQYLTLFLESKGMLPELLETLCEYKVDLLCQNYNNIPDDMKNLYLEKARSILSLKDYKILNRKIRMNNCSIIERIFSVRNKYNNALKIKMITVLGIDFEIKKYINQG